MINTENNNNGVANGTTAPPAHDKQPPNTPKKTALRDVQNENVGSIPKQQESSFPGGGKSNGDTVKVCGSKRLTPERPSISHGLPSLDYNGTNENVMNARRRFELELGRGRLHNNIEKFSQFSELKNAGGQLRQEVSQKSTQKKDSNVHHTPKSSNRTATLGPTSNNQTATLGKQGNITAAAKVSSEIPRTVDSKVTGDQLRTERFIRLQKFLKQCDETNQREYAQKLLRLSPSELSKHAVELEKRAIQLTIEEGNEMQRMKALNILGKSSPANNLLKSTQILQSGKH
ncbi:hypothetical protein OROMI_010593 [Orobanche minor]